VEDEDERPRMKTDAPSPTTRGTLDLLPDLDHMPLPALRLLCVEGVPN
jgi:hypothetical protein